MVEQDPWLDDLRKRQAKEEAVRLEEAKKKAAEIGKEPFNLSELEKYWSYRYANKLSKKEYLKDMLEYEERYYFSGKRFMTMEAFGKHLTEMDLYS